MKQTIKQLDALIKWYKQFKPEITEITLTERQKKEFCNSFPQKWSDISNTGDYRGFVLKSDPNLTDKRGKPYERKSST